MQTPAQCPQALVVKAASLAQTLISKRHYTEAREEGALGPRAAYDPRILVFEFVHHIMLRETQVQLVSRLMEAATHGISLCHQMIMGAGKTTVCAFQGCARDERGGGGMRAKKKSVYVKWASHFLALYSKFDFSREENFFGFGWMGGLAGRGGVRQITPPPLCRG